MTEFAKEINELMGLPYTGHRWSQVWSYSDLEAVNNSSQFILNQLILPYMKMNGEGAATSFLAEAFVDGKANSGSGVKKLRIMWQ